MAARQGEAVLRVAVVAVRAHMLVARQASKLELLHDEHDYKAQRQNHPRRPMRQLLVLYNPESPVTVRRSVGMDEG